MISIKPFKDEYDGDDNLADANDDKSSGNDYDGKDEIDEQGCL